MSKYNRKGYLIEESIYRASGKLISKTTWRYKKDSVEKVVKFSNTSISSSFSSYQYFKGILASRKGYRFNFRGMSNRFLETLKYNDKGELQEIKFYKYRDFRFLVFTKNYKYDKNGNLIEIKKYDKNNQLVESRSIDKIKYNSYNQIVFQKKCNNNGSISISTEYTYYGKTEKIKKKDYKMYGLNGNVVFNIVYQYNEKGECIKKIQIRKRKKKTVTISIYQYDYDKKGNVTKIVEYNKMSDKPGKKIISNIDEYKIMYY